MVITIFFQIYNNLGLFLIYFGLILDIFGTVVLIGKPSLRFIKSNFNKDIKKDLEDEAIKKSFGRLAGKREENLKDDFVISYLGDYKNAFFAISFLILEFILQLMGNIINHL